MKTIIRAAVDSGRPPLELLLDEPDRPRCKWDGKLIKALYLQEAFDLEGHPIWVEESPAVSFVARRRDVRSLKVVEDATAAHQKGKNPANGARFYAEAKLLPGQTWPTRTEWLKKKTQSPGEFAASDKVAEARIAEAEARAAEKAAANPDVARIIDEVKARVKRASDRLDG